MRKQIITTDRIENILSGKEIAFIDYSNTQPRIVIKDSEFGYFYMSNTIEVPYDLIFESCNFMQPFYLNVFSKNNISFTFNCNHGEDLTLNVECRELHLNFSSIRHLITFSNGCKIENVICRIDTTNLFISGGLYNRFLINCFNKDGSNSNIALKIDNAYFREYLEIDTQMSNNLNLFGSTIIKKYICKKNIYFKLYL